MLFELNNTVSIKRLVESDGKTSFSKGITNGLRVYLFQPTDGFANMGDVDGGVITKKMLTSFKDIIVGDKVIDENDIEYIIRDITPRKTFIVTFNEVTIVEQYD